MNRPEGFLTMGARVDYWVALGVAGLILAVYALGRIAFAIGGAA